MLVLRIARTEKLSKVCFGGDILHFLVLAGAQKHFVSPTHTVALLFAQENHRKAIFVSKYWYDVFGIHIRWCSRNICVLGQLFVIVFLIKNSLFSKL